MKSYTVKLAGKEYEILQDKDGKFIKPDFVKKLESYGTDVKPAHEPICVARKPLDGTVANNVLTHGTGGLNIDGTRVGTETMINQSASSIYSQGETKMQKQDPTIATGRFPANLIHDGSDEVEAVFPHSKDGTAGKRNAQNGDVMKTGLGATNSTWGGYGGSGSASRFFYTAKASKSERNAGLEGFEERIAGGMQGRADGSLAGSIVYNKNVHPTVKPLSLTKYLATLIKPPTGGRLLVPFSGSGSEMIGALQAGWEYVEGVELTEEYIPIAEARIKYWTELEENKPAQEKLL